MAKVTIVGVRPAMDGALKKAVMNFIAKLSEDDTAPGLDIEPIQHADPKVRTGRVTLSWRAVLTKICTDGEPHYILHGVWPHDRAIEIAKSLRVESNPRFSAINIYTVADTHKTTPTIAMTQPPATVPSSWLATRGYSAEGLCEQLGLPRKVADRAMAVTSPEALETLARQESGWITDALFGLASPTVTLQDIIDSLELEEARPDLPEDEQIARALRTPAGKAHFAYIEDQDELRQLIEDGDFGKWRVFLHPEQRKYATESYKGPFRLTGAAGTGKTVVLVHRAKMLADRYPGARIVLTTFTHNLAESLRDMLADLDRTIPITSFGKAGVCAQSIDGLIFATVKRAGKAIDDATTRVLGRPRANMRIGTDNSTWTSAIDRAFASLPTEIANESFFQNEYTCVILPNRIVTLEDYLRTSRTGRRVALSADKREAVWNVVADYRSMCQQQGTIDYAEAAAIATVWLERHPRAPRADHILVDESQDLSPVQWQFLRALVAPGHNDLFIAEDAHQRIYGQRIVLGQYGIKIVGRSRRLTLNYRTTAQNLRAAMTTLQGGDYRDSEDDTRPVEIAGYRSARTGPEPVTIHAKGQDDEARIVAEQIRRWLEADPDGPPESIAVLVHGGRDRMVAGLVDNGVPTLGVGRERPTPGKPLVMTMHRAKGLEFSKVVLIDHDAWPLYNTNRTEHWDESLKQDADLRERSLTYVAMTRARDELVIIDRT